MADLDLRSSEVILQILTETNKSEERDRRRSAYNAYQVYSGNQQIYVEKQLAITRPKSYMSYTISDISISKMVTDKRAQSYNEKPIREVPGNESKSERLDDIYKEGNANRELQFYDTLFNLNRYATMWVNYRPDTDKYQFMSLHAYEVMLVRDKDTGEVLIVGLNYPSSEITNDARGTSFDGTTSGGDGIADLIAENQADGATPGEVWVFWSKGQHVKVRTKQVKEVVQGETVLKKDVDYITIPDNPNMVNPLGVLPFVFQSTDTAVDYPTVNPLTNQSITFNVQQSETLTAKNIHGSGIQVFKYPEKMKGMFHDMEQGQTVAVELPQSSNPDDKPTEFEYKTSGAQLAPMLEIDMNYLSQILHEHGLENTKIEQGKVDALSGVSKAISESSVQKVIEMNQQTYVELEQKMFDVIKAIETFRGQSVFSEDDDLKITFSKPKVMVSDEQTLKNIELMLKLGLIEEWEKFIKMDPNLSEEEAKDKLDRIKETEEQKVVGFLDRMPNGGQRNRVDQESEIELERIEPGSEG